MAGGGGSSTSLEYTPTWAVATVCFFIISISMILEHFIHLLSNWLMKHRKMALYDAVGRLKSELMLLGFLSLLLAVSQESIANICVPPEVANSMLPCRKEIVTRGTETLAVVYGDFNSGPAYPDFVLPHDSSNMSKSKLYSARLADDNEDDDDNYNNDHSVGGVYKADNNSYATTDPCSSKGKVTLVTQEGVQQLQHFIFVLAVMQIVYSLLTMALGRAKMRRWKAWERETQTTEYQINNDPNRFRFTRQTTFGRRHETWTETRLQLWIKCFFRQFFSSVAKVDYLTLRHGFITAHMSARLNSFNFQKYIEHSLDEDFKIVVSISPLMWFLVVIFMLVDVYGWHSYLWISYVPLLIVLVLGTKLEVIVEKMAVQLKNQNSVIIGAPLVKPNDDFFWFRRPRFVLHLLHLTLFVNAFEMAFFVWVTIQFSFDSCYHEHIAFIVTRVALAVAVQVLCSYITLPLYALVTQMGSEFKGGILKDEVAQVLKHWHAQVRERRKKNEHEHEHVRTQSPHTTAMDLTNSLSKSSSQNPPFSVPAEANYIQNLSEIREEHADQS